MSILIRQLDDLGVQYVPKSGLFVSSMLRFEPHSWWSKKSNCLITHFWLTSRSSYLFQEAFQIDHCQVGGSGGETPTYLAFNLVSLKHKCKKLFLSLSQLQTKKPNMYLFRKLLLHYLLNAISYQISKCKVPKFRNVFFSSQMSCKIAKISKKVWICVFRKSFVFF